MPETIQSEVRYRGNRFCVETLSRLGASGRRVKRDVVRHPGAVVIVPVLDDRSGGGRVVLIRNERIAVGERLWELPAGTLEPPEPPIDAAARELREETGYSAGSVRAIGSFFTSPGFLDERLHLFVADGLTPGDQHLEDGEDIEVSEVCVADAFAMIADGRIRDAKTIAGLLMWDRWFRETTP